MVPVAASFLSQETSGERGRSVGRAWTTWPVLKGRLSLAALLCQAGVGDARASPGRLCPLPAPGVPGRSSRPVGEPQQGRLGAFNLPPVSPGSWNGGQRAGAPLPAV